MKLQFEIVEYDRGPAGILYSVQFSDRTECEFDLFLDDEECANDPEFDNVRVLFGDMMDTLGFPREFFKIGREHGYPETLGYLTEVADDYNSPAIYDRPPTRKPRPLNLRIYCSWWMERVVIVGGGCVKPGGGPLQNYPHCGEVYNRMLLMYRKLNASYLSNRTRIDSDGITGQLKFEGEL